MQNAFGVFERAGPSWNPSKYGFDQLDENSHIIFEMKRNNGICLDYGKNKAI